MVHNILEKVFWLTPPILQTIIVVVMWRRGLHRKLPFFFCYTFFVSLHEAGLWVLRNHRTILFYGYWYGELIISVLEFAVIYEIYASLLKEYAVLHKTGIVLFRVAGIILAVIAVVTAFNSPGSDVHKFIQGALTLERSVRIVQCGLLIALFVFASFFGLSWKDQLFGIALGFAIYSCVELAVVAVRAYWGNSQNASYALLNPAAYNLAVWIWTFYVVKSRRGPDLPTLPKTQLTEWNETLQELLHR